MEVSSCEGGSSPATAAATATATAARKEERSKLVQSPKAIPSKRRAGTPHSHHARPASDGGREERREGRREREREKEGMYGHAWACHPCHVMLCRVTATYAVGRVVDTSAAHVGASGAP